MATLGFPNSICLKKRSSHIEGCPWTISLSTNKFKRMEFKHAQQYSFEGNQ